jgi:creatinine amidohydrolase
VRQAELRRPKTLTGYRHGMSRQYMDLSGPEIATEISPSSILLLPIGAVEQHGPHLPMSVDAVIADETATAVVNECGDELDVWQLPTISISKSNEHAWSPGTLYLSPETMMAMLRDIGRSVASTGAERLVLLNAHGGNTTHLGTALRELRLQFGLKTFLMHPSLPPAYGGASTEEELGMGIHGSKNETSVFMHLRPGETKLELAERKVPEAIAENEHVKFGGSVSFGWLSNDFDPDGYIGDPTGASEELGAELFTHAVGKLAEGMEEVKTFDFGR